MKLTAPVLSVGCAILVAAGSVHAAPGPAQAMGPEGLWLKVMSTRHYARLVQEWVALIDRAHPRG